MSKATVSLIMTLGVMLATCGPGTAPDGQLASPSPQATPTSSTSPQPTQVWRTSPTPGSADTWVAAGALNVHRVGTQLARLGTGEVLAVGDDLLCGIEQEETDTAELWGPAQGAWRMAASLPTQRNGIVLVPAADGDALVTGGANADYVAKSSTVVFDDRMREWSQSGLLNTARMAFAAAALPDGRVLVAGGLLIDFSNEGRALDSAEIWDPDTGSWADIDEMSSPRLGAVAVTLSDGRVLVAGGVPVWGGDNPLVSAEIYDPGGHRWSAAGTLSAPRNGFSVVALPDGGALAVGGSVASTEGAGGEAFQPTTIVERLDPLTGTWARTDGFDASGRRPAMAVLADGRVLAVAGANTAIYDPEAGTWTASTPIPDHRNDATAVLLEDGSVLVAGGWWRWVPDTPGCPTPIPDTWRFIPATPPHQGWFRGLRPTAGARPGHRGRGALGPGRGSRGGWRGPRDRDGSPLGKIVVGGAEMLPQSGLKRS